MTLQGLKAKAKGNRDWGTSVVTIVSKPEDNP
jgi:hypothetical protein